MKKILLGLSAALATMAFVGCNNLPTNADSADITLGLSSTTVSAGNSINITGNVDASAPPSVTYAIEAISAGGTTGVTASGTTVTGKNKVDFQNDLQAKIMTTSASCNGTYALIVTATAGSATSSKRDTFTVTGGVDCSSTGSTDTILTSTSVVLGSLSANPSFLDAATMTAYGSGTVTANQANIDLQYGTLGTGGATFMSPLWASTNYTGSATASWSSPNATMFVRAPSTTSLTSLDSLSMLRAIFAAGSQVDHVTNVSQNDIIVLMTHTGYPVALIITGTNGTGGNMDLTVKGYHQ